MLNEFKIFSTAASMESTEEHQGTNSLRFALLANYGMSSTETVDPHDTFSSPGQKFEQFGFHPRALHKLTDAQAQSGQIAKEVEYLHANWQRSWDPDLARTEAWTSLIEESNPDARLILLLAGLSSRLERESAAAATSILNSVPVVRLDRDEAKLLRFGADSTEIHALAPASEWQEPSYGSDAEPGTELPWDANTWARYSRYWINQITDSTSTRAVIAAVRQLARVRQGLGRSSADPIVREFSLAGALTVGNTNDGTSLSNTMSDSEDSSDSSVSTMVHGTWGWKGDWWYPGGDFHTHILRQHRNDLYSGGREFSWSGAYSSKSRETAAQRFSRWVKADKKRPALNTVFAHSYGGEVVARAINHGTAAKDVVLLSAPIHRHHELMAGKVNHVYDVRLKFDIVLLLARARQKLSGSSNITEFQIARPFWSHGATHDPDVWMAEDIASQIGL